MYSPSVVRSRESCAPKGECDVAAGSYKERVRALYSLQDGTDVWNIRTGDEGSRCGGRCGLPERVEDVVDAPLVSECSVCVASVGRVNGDGDGACSPSTGAVIGSTVPAPERMRRVPDANVGTNARLRLASVTNQTYPVPAIPLTAAENSERSESKPPNCFWTAVPK